MKYEDIKTPEQLLQFMSDNINYGFVGKKGKVYKNIDIGIEENNRTWSEECIVQDGEKLLQSHYGTCWDQVELERKWFQEHGYQYRTIFMWFEVNRPNILPTHTFLIYTENNKWYWFEHAFDLYRGIHEFESVERLIEKIMDIQFNLALENKGVSLEEKKCLKVYEYSKPEPNLDINGYIEYVTKN